MKQQHTRFYLIIASLLLLIVLLGFGPRFFLRPFFDQPKHMQMAELPIKFVLHGVLMTLWYMLLVLQSALINVKNLKLHMRMGWLMTGIAILVVLFAVPVMMGFAPRMLSLGFIDINKTETLKPQAWMWYNDVMALIGFATLVFIAILGRTKVELHRSFVLFASMMFMAPAIARMLEWMTKGLSFMSFITIGLSIMFALPIAVVVHDWWRYKRFPIYPAIGLSLMIMFIVLNFIVPNTQWGMNLFLQHIK
jgi:hypothetical protein